jgi:hypothetical protein
MPLRVLSRPWHLLTFQFHLQQRMPAGETTIAVPFTLVDKMPVHAAVGNAVRMPIKDLAVEPREAITPKSLFGALPQRVLRPFADMVNAHAPSRLVKCQQHWARWSVSNFTVHQMEELFHIPQGDRCATNQVLYNLDDRGIEQDLLPWCEQHGMPVMAYSPLGGPGASLAGDPTLARIGAAHGCSAAAVARAWTIRSGNVIAIAESGSVPHVKENAVALSLTLTPQELQTLHVAHLPPSR